METQKMYINGMWCEGEKTFDEATAAHSFIHSKRYFFLFIIKLLVL